MLTFFRETKINWKSRSQNRVLLTGCCGASLIILNTWATFPLARRCILKPGMAHLVARLIILQRWQRGSNKWRVVHLVGEIFFSLKTMRNDGIMWSSPLLNPHHYFWFLSPMWAVVYFYPVKIVHPVLSSQLKPEKHSKAGPPAAFSEAKVVSGEQIQFQQYKDFAVLQKNTFYLGILPQLSQQFNREEQGKI